MVAWRQLLITLPPIKIRFLRYACCSKQFLLRCIFINCSIFYTFKIVNRFIKSVLSNESNSILNVLKFVPGFLTSVRFDTDISAVQNRKFWVAEPTNHGDCWVVCVTFGWSVCMMRSEMTMKLQCHYVLFISNRTKRCEIDIFSSLFALKFHRRFRSNTAKSPVTVQSKRL